MGIRFDRLEALAQRAGYKNDAALARAASLDRAVISNLRSGKRVAVSFATAQRLARAVGTSVDYLLGVTDQEGAARDSLAPELALMADRIATLSAPRRAELSALIETLRRADTVEQDYRDALLRIAEAFLSEEHLLSLATAFDLVRAGDEDGATTLVDSVIDQVNSQNPKHKPAQ